MALWIKKRCSGWIVLKGEIKTVKCSAKGRGRSSCRREGAWLVRWPTSSLYWAVMHPGCTHWPQVAATLCLEVSPVNEVKYSETPAPAPWTIEWSKCMCIFRIWRMKQQNCAKRNYIYLICSYRVGMEEQQRALDVSHLGRCVIIQGLAWFLWVIHQSHFKAGTAWWELSVPPERYLENSSWEWDSKRYVCSWRAISKLT